MGTYYRTYSITVEEVKNNLKSDSDFIKGPMPSGRDSMDNLKAGFVVVDNNYISARWPGDVYNFGNAIIKKLGEICAV